MNCRIVHASNGCSCPKVVNFENENKYFEWFDAMMIIKAWSCHANSDAVHFDAKKCKEEARAWSQMVREFATEWGFERVLKDIRHAANKAEEMLKLKKTNFDDDVDSFDSLK